MERKVIAITGYIGSGKSLVSNFLRQMGYKTVDCDEIAKQISEQPDTVCAVKELLGDDYVQNGHLNRKAIRLKVFSDPELLKEYQALFFGAVKSRLNDIVSQSRETVFVEIPVIDAFDFPWDEIWLIQCDRKILFDRVAARDGVTADSIAEILSRQKQPNPTRTILNDGDLSDLRKAVIDALAQAKL